MTVKFVRPEPTTIAVKNKIANISGLVKAGIRILYTSDQWLEDFFYLNPNDWTESKSSKWITQDIPGMSDPVLQWMGCGERTLNFTALVTKDTSHNNQIKDWGPIGQNAKITDITIIDKRLADLALDPNDEIVKAAYETLIKNDDSCGYPLDITKKIDLYRSLVYPRSLGNEGATCPPLIQIFCGTSLGIRNLASMYWAVQKVDIKIIRQLPNLLPIEAEVGFNLIEYVPNNVTTNSPQVRTGEK